MVGAGGGSGEGAAERREGGACTRLMWYIGSHFELRRFAISASSIGSSSSATARFREDCADMVRTRGEGVGMVLMGAACREESTSAMPFPSAALCLGSLEWSWSSLSHWLLACQRRIREASYSSVAALSALVARTPLKRKATSRSLRNAQGDRRWRALQAGADKGAQHGGGRHRGAHHLL